MGDSAGEHDTPHVPSLVKRYDDQAAQQTV